MLDYKFKRFIFNKTLRVCFEDGFFLFFRDGFTKIEVVLKKASVSAALPHTFSAHPARPRSERRPGNCGHSYKKERCLPPHRTQKRCAAPRKGSSDPRKRSGGLHTRTFRRAPSPRKKGAATLHGSPLPRSGAPPHRAEPHFLL